MGEIDELLTRIKPLQQAAMEEARQRQGQLTKPTGSLGRLEEIAIRMAGITGNVTPQVSRKAVVVMAADHGVAREGVSAYPVEVTAQMVLNFLHGGAAINVLARQASASVTVVDIGVATELSHPQLLARKVRPGTANMAQEPAMSHAEMLQAIHVGIDVINDLIDKGLDIVAIGEMGIGNTTAASAITACILQVPVVEVTGRGTGLNDQQLAQKVRVIERSIALNQPQADDALAILASVGGLEIAGLTGIVLGAVARRIPVVLDGFISSTAALVAYALNPVVGDYLFAGHVSVERGHRLILEKMGLTPLLDLQMRLGEGSGAVLALHLIDGAVRTHAEMSTFAEAGVSDKE